MYTRQVQGVSGRSRSITAGIRYQRGAWHEHSIGHVKGHKKNYDTINTNLNIGRSFVL